MRMTACAPEVASNVDKPYLVDLGRLNISKAAVPYHNYNISHMYSTILLVIRQMKLQVSDSLA